MSAAATPAATGTAPGAPRASGALLRPLPLAALAVMALNDHVLRARFPGLVTGKLSDVAVLLYLPALLLAGTGLALEGWNALSRRRGAVPLDAGLGPRRIAGAVLLSGLALALLKLSPAARDLYVAALERIPGGGGHHRLCCDPTDLVALAVLPLAALDALAHARQAPP